MFHRQFPDRRISPWTLSKVMRQAGLKKKKVIVRNTPKTWDQQKYDEAILKLDQKI